MTRQRALYRSAIRSKRQLQEAFSELLQEKDYGRITVTDVTTRANLNRSTFYAHYGNIADLARDVFEKTAQGLYDLLESKLTSSLSENPEPALKELSVYLLREENLYRLLVRARQADRYSELVRSTVLEIVRKKMNPNPGHPYSTNFLAATELMVSGIIAVYNSWLNGSYGDVDIAALNTQVANYIKWTAPGFKG